MNYFFSTRPFFVMLLVLTSCDFLAYTNKPEDDFDQYINEWNEEYQPNYKPRYGILEKAVEYQNIDREYLSTRLNKFMDTLTLAKKLAAEGWDYFSQSKMDSAMFRFNQCWLLDSTYLECYYGYAAIKEYQGMKDDANMYYQLGFNHDTKDTLSKKIRTKIEKMKQYQKRSLINN